MKLHTYAGNVHALQSLIVARYNGVEIELPPFEMGKDNKTKAFLAKSPMGKVPVLETPGLHLRGGGDRAVRRAHPRRLQHVRLLLLRGRPR